MPRLASRPVLLLALAAVAFPPMLAAQIYKWVDENGRIQLSDKPPQTHGGSLTRQASGTHELTEAQRAEAQARAARESQRAAAEAARQEAEDKAAAQGPIIIQPTGAPRGAASASASSGSSSSASPSDARAADCARKWAAYNASAACYGPFRNAIGGLRAGALETCGPGVPDPSIECGMPRR
ncbi:MAG TPA: DUF4124 domain-containing protein [Ramlibacter sp.]|nr:DUF4124 domain-containing protein [Ramlibacter sp.]